MRKTHGMETGTTRGAFTGWMSEFPQEIPTQLRVCLDGLGKDRGDDMDVYFQIYRLPPGTKPSDILEPEEFIQAGGSAERLTVEIRRIEADGEAHQYTIGRRGAAEEAGESQVVRIGDYEISVRPSEVLTAAEAFDLFQHYYDHHGVPEGWDLRPIAGEVLAARDDQNDDRS